MLSQWLPQKFTNGDSILTPLEYSHVYTYFLFDTKAVTTLAAFVELSVYSTRFMYIDIYSSKCELLDDLS